MKFDIIKIKTSFACEKDRGSEVRPIMSKNICTNDYLFHIECLWTSLSNVLNLLTVSLAVIMAPGLFGPVNFDFLQTDNSKQQTNSYSRIVAYLKRPLQFWH